MLLFTKKKRYENEDFHYKYSFEFNVSNETEINLIDDESIQIKEGDVDVSIFPREDIKTWENKLQSIIKLLHEKALSFKSRGSSVNLTPLGTTDVITRSDIGTSRRGSFSSKVEVGSLETRDKKKRGSTMNIFENIVSNFSDKISVVDKSTSMKNLHASSDSNEGGLGLGDSADTSLMSINIGSHKKKLKKRDSDTSSTTPRSRKNKETKQQQ